MTLRRLIILAWLFALCALGQAQDLSALAIVERAAQEAETAKQIVSTPQTQHPAYSSHFRTWTSC